MEERRCGFCGEPARYACESCSTLSCHEHGHGALEDLWFCDECPPQADPGNPMPIRWEEAMTDDPKPIRHTPKREYESIDDLLDRWPVCCSVWPVDSLGGAAHSECAQAALNIVEKLRLHRQRFGTADPSGDRLRRRLEALEGLHLTVHAFTRDHDLDDFAGWEEMREALRRVRECS